MGIACLWTVWSLSWKYLKTESDCMTGRVDHLKASSIRLAPGLGELEGLRTRAPEHDYPMLPSFLTIWRPQDGWTSYMVASLLVPMFWRTRQKLHCLLWLSLRSHAWSLLPHSTGYKEVQAHLDWRRGHRLAFLMGNCQGHIVKG